MGYFPQKFLVYFYDPPREEWYHKYRKKGFSHCGVIYLNTKKNKWLMVEHIHKLLATHILDEEEVDGIIDYIYEHNGCVVMTDKFKQKWRLLQAAWLREHSCVTIAMRLMGINKLIITPFQLYKYLINNGGKQWEYLEHQNIKSQKQK